MVILSFFQFALPAVVLSVLLHTSLIPPVLAVKADKREEVRRASRRERKEVARECLCVSKSWRARRDSRARRAVVVAFEGLAGARGFFLGEVDSEVGGLVDGKSGSFLVGECVSFQSSTNSRDQKKSEEGRWGVVGMRGSFLGEDGGGGNVVDDDGFALSLGILGQGGGGLVV